MNDKEKIESYRKDIAEALQILDEIIEIIRFQDNPEDTIIDQKLEEIQKILSQEFYSISRIVKFISGNKNQNLFEANYDRR